jgi:hypothetical protein
MFGYQHPTIRKWIRQGKLPAFEMPDGTTRVRLSDLVKPRIGRSRLGPKVPPKLPARPKRKPNDGVE